MNTLARDSNETIRGGNQHVYEMLSELGKNLYFPKGILTQTAEAQQKAHRYDATIGIAIENGHPMYLPSVMEPVSGLEPGDVLPYAKAGGTPELRAKWREEIHEKNPSLHDKHMSLPVVTSGITHGISLVGDLFVDESDIVVMPDKAWGNYGLTFNVCRGAEIVRHRLFSETGGFDIASFQKTLLDSSLRGKVIVLLNFPNNPTGYSVTEEEAVGICKAMKTIADNGCNVVAICDDAYFGLFYEHDTFKESLFGLLANSHERILAIKLDGATKENFAWGLRVGFMTFSTVCEGSGLYDALEKKVAGAIRANISNCSRLSQTIILKALTSETYSQESGEKRAILSRRAAKVKEVLADDRYTAVWTPYPFNSGYFMCLKLKEIKAEDYRLRLLDEYGIGVIAIGDHDIRVAFSCVEEEDISELFDLMFRCAQEMLNRRDREGQFSNQSNRGKAEQQETAAH